MFLLVRRKNYILDFQAQEEFGGITYIDYTHYLLDGNEL